MLALLPLSECIIDSLQNRSGAPVDSWHTRAGSPSAPALPVCPQAAVEMSRKYRHVAWYSLFVAAYMVVLYLQVSRHNPGLNPTLHASA